MNKPSGDARLELLTQWIRGDLAMPDAAIAPASADASFRRYFRITRSHDPATPMIVMDAPPGKEDLAPFLRAANLLRDIGVRVPEILQQDLQRGFLLLSDLGSRQYLAALQAGENIDALYADALGALVRIQRRGRESGRVLPAYDHDTLLREMNLLPEWFAGRHLGLTLDTAANAMLQRVFERFASCALEQPRSLVHRDYHSRNLMVVPSGNPGILDFQDAVYGAITYDLVSLLKDCYIAWPAARVRAWMLDFRGQLLAGGEPAGRDSTEFERWFDFMGLQRHAKVLGIFARLWYRDGKIGYLSDLPLVLRYTTETAARYAELDELSRWLNDVVAPAFSTAQQRELG